MDIIPPQQGDSNLGWVGGHQWGQSWRDRPPAARRPPAGRPTVSLCNRHNVSLCNTHNVCLCNTKTAYFGSKMTQKSKMPPNGSPCHHFDLSGRGNGSHGPPGAIGTIPGSKTGIFFCLPPGPPAGGQPFRAGYTGFPSWGYSAAGNAAYTGMS